MPDNDERKPPATGRCGDKGDDVNDDECKPPTKRSCDEWGHDFILDNFDRKKHHDRSIITKNIQWEKKLKISNVEKIQDDFLLDTLAKEFYTTKFLG